MAEDTAAGLTAASLLEVDGIKLTVGAPSDSSKVEEWSIGSDSASVTGAGAVLKKQTSGLLTITAEIDGYLTFSYSSNAYSVTFGGTAEYTDVDGNVAANMSANDTLTVQATFNNPTAKTLSITGITFNADAVAAIGTTQYTTVEAALSAAASGDTVRLISDAAVTSDCSVPSGVMLLVPYAADDTGVTDSYDRHGTLDTSVYLTLTVEAGVTMTVNGTLTVNAKVQGCGDIQEGCVSGAYGNMTVNGSLVVANGGALYARGRITGSGSIDAQSGAAVYELIQIKDWRGGTVAMDMLGAGSVFPSNRFYCTNIQCATVLRYGARLYGQEFYSPADYYYDFLLPFVVLVNKSVLLIGDDTEENCWIRLKADSRIELSYDAEILSITTHGAVEVDSLTLSASTGLTVETVQSQDYVCPIPEYISLVIADGTVTVKNSYKFLPGASVQVKGGASLVVEGGLYFYTADAYKTDYTYNFSGWCAPVKDAVLTAAGTVTGDIYSSDRAMRNIVIEG